jgi:hypothetical protein
MYNVTLSDGTTVESYLFFYHDGPPQIHIYPVELGPSDIYRLFDNPDLTQNITVEMDARNAETGEPERVTVEYHGFTELFSVQRSTYHPEKKEYMVWLQRPTESL